MKKNEFKIIKNVIDHLSEENAKLRDKVQYGTPAVMDEDNPEFVNLSDFGGRDPEQLAKELEEMNTSDEAPLHYNDIVQDRKMQHLHAKIESVHTIAGNRIAGLYELIEELGDKIMKLEQDSEYEDEDFEGFEPCAAGDAVQEFESCVPRIESEEDDAAFRTFKDMLKRPIAMDEDWNLKVWMDKIMRLYNYFYSADFMRYAEQRHAEHYAYLKDKEKENIAREILLDEAKDGESCEE